MSPLGPLFLPVHQCSMHQTLGLILSSNRMLFPSATRRSMQLLIVIPRLQFMYLCCDKRLRNSSSTILLRLLLFCLIFPIQAPFTEQQYRYMTYCSFQQYLPICAVKCLDIGYELSMDITELVFMPQCFLQCLTAHRWLICGTFYESCIHVQQPPFSRLAGQKFPSFIPAPSFLPLTFCINSVLQANNFLRRKTDY